MAQKGVDDDREVMIVKLTYLHVATSSLMFGRIRRSWDLSASNDLDLLVD
jgi:hypothetical protein